MAIQYTRADYMAARVDFWAYWEQFITPEVQRAVILGIGADRIKASTDPYLNDIPLSLFHELIGFRDSAAPTPCRNQMDVAPLVREAGDSVSASTLLCIMKAYCRQLKLKGES
jgi:hypothetical protein